jgi:putative ABC transport system ATP-binding protein
MAFIGDAVMAVFGAPFPQPDHAVRALQAARAMHATQDELNRRGRAASLPPFHIGIGLSTGEVAAALLGSEERLEYTVVGDTVNLAQRLQQWAGPGQIVLSEPTWAALDTAVDAEHLPAGPGQGPQRRRRRLPHHHGNSRRMTMDQQQARPDTVVRVVGLRKTYESEGMPVRALRGVDFEMAPGEFVAVMGPSGCGKSTLLNLVAGLDTPSEGEITVAGEPLAGKDENDLARMRRRHIGIVFQFFNLLEGMTCLENVALPAMIAGSSRKQAERRARDLLDLLGLGDKTASVPGVLSGGQRQRLAIARALANQPTMLLADEPTGALDSAGGAEVMELFRRLHAGGQTILLVTHDQEVAAAASRIAWMRDGRMANGEPEPTTPTLVAQPRP